MWDDNRMPNDIKDVEAKYGRRPDVYKDYRKILDRKDIDAVIVGTPDHWHALVLTHACEAGKDAYCEKPISHDIVEALSMAGAVKRYNRVVQCGTWQRSTKEFTDAIEYVRSGKLGKVVLCRAWISDDFRAGRQKPSDPPKGLDYDMWVGPAAYVPISVQPMPLELALVYEFRRRYEHGLGCPHDGHRPSRHEQRREPGDANFGERHRRPVGDHRR